MTLLHEAGHAFHAFASHAQPLIWQRHPGSEAAELASMSMELLAAPHLAQPVGYFTPRGSSQRLARAPGGHAAQPGRTSRRWMRSRPGSTPAARAATRRRATRRGSGSASRFERGVDWSGLRAGAGGPLVPPAPHLHVSRSTTSSTASPRSAHSRSGATASQDPASAVARYREALALGAVRGLPEMYRAAGARAHVRRGDDRRAGAAGRGGDRAGPGGAACASRSATRRRRLRAVAWHARVASRACRRKIPCRRARRRGAVCMVPAAERRGWRKKKGSRWRAS